jgi:hypothetical protein
MLRFSEFYRFTPASTLEFVGLRHFPGFFCSLGCHLGYSEVNLYIYERLSKVGS